MKKEQTIEIGTLVSFKSKKELKNGKVIKIYQENDKTYYKIICDKKYYYKQLKSIEICN